MKKRKDNRYATMEQFYSYFFDTCVRCKNSLCSIKCKWHDRTKCKYVCTVLVASLSFYTLLISIYLSHLYLATYVRTVQQLLFTYYKIRNQRRKSFLCVIPVSHIIGHVLNYNNRIDLPSFRFFAMPNSISIRCL